MDSKTIAIISYLTIIGWIIALVMDTKKEPLARFHIRQSLLIGLIGLVLSFIPIIGWILSIAVLVLWILGLIGAINGEQKPVPVVGPYAQDWFKGL